LKEAGFMFLKNFSKTGGLLKVPTALSEDRRGGGKNLNGPLRPFLTHE
jgi:hypothetical protein